MNIGIFFGGRSREREIAFAGGRTIYDNLNKAFFKPIPIFVDSQNRFIRLNWQYIYKGTIRDFYPYSKSQTSSIYIESVRQESWQKESIERIGKQIYPYEFKTYFDMAFLVLHGVGGEDGTLQGLLEWYDIPYSGADIFSSSVGIDKYLQKKLFQYINIQTPDSRVVDYKTWQNIDQLFFFEKLKKELGLPLVIKPSLQGSSIGVYIVRYDNFQDFIRHTNKAFFCEKLSIKTWNIKNHEQKKTMWMI